MGLDPISGVGGLIYGAVKLLDWLRPDVPNIKTPQQRARAQGGSPNNQLGRRSNEARPEQRIPYILGNARSVPDMLMVPYTIYENHVEVEYGYFCVGQGAHTISDIRDGDILISQIDGASAEVYGPGKAPTGGFGLHDPDLTIGESITDDVYTVYEVEAVNGQELFGFSDHTFYGSLFPNNSKNPLFMAFFDNGDGTGRIDVPFAAAPDEITDRVELGDLLFIAWPMAHIPPGGVGTAPDLNTPVTSAAGHPVVVVAPEVVTINVPVDPIYVELTVNIPVSQQAEWALLQTYFEDLQDPGDLFPYTGATFEFARVTPLSHLYAGPFFVDFEHPPGSTAFEIVCNFVAPRGLFADDGVTTRKLDVEIQVIITPADSSGNPNGTPQAFQGTLQGSATARGQRALTLRCAPVGLTSTRVLVQARRLTNSPRRVRMADNVEVDMFGADLVGDPDADPPVPPTFRHFSGTVADEIRWTHCYSMSKPPNISFGDVTTIHTRTVATRGALRVKNRRLNCLATRLIQTWNGTTFGGALLANDRSQNVLFTVLKDPTIGGLADANIDFAGIAAAFEQVRQTVFSQFPTPLGDATRFSYTFDDADLSLEETMQAICQAAFCVAYRDGDVIKVRPELATDDSVLLLNHRNTIQGSQRITHTFGKAEENDSVEVAYVDPFDDANTKVVVPKHFSGIRKTRQIKVVGLRSSLQAYWHAYRALHKMLYQRQAMTVEATSEAEELGTRQRVLVANETRAGAQTGEILGILAPGDRVLTSQPVALDPGVEYRIHLQHPDGSVYDRRIITAVSSRELQLAGSLADVITDPGAGVRTTYLILHPEQPEPSAFLVSTTSPTGNLTHQIEAVNYSHMYYVADGLTCWVDFANGLSDLSPQQRLFTNNGGVVGSGVWTGGAGDYFEVLEPTEDEQSDNYTKIVWINATAAPTDSGLIRTDTGGDEAFEITPGNLLVAGHGAFDVSADYSTFTGSMHMAAVTYDATAQRMALFIDGTLVDEASVAPATTGSPLRYLEGFEGTCRMVAKWGRCMADREVTEFYLRTR